MERIGCIEDIRIVSARDRFLRAGGHRFKGLAGQISARRPCDESDRTYLRIMELDDQLRRYFGTADLAAVTPAMMESGLDHMRVDLGLETDRGQRFGLWALMHILGDAPDPEAAFEEEEDREAARNFMALADQMGQA
jgi:hypothetical protein